MSWAPDYVTLAQLKDHLRITDTADDTLLGFAITAASRAVDQATNRQFGQTTAEARYYTFNGPTYRAFDSMLTGYLNDTYRGRESLEIDDLMTTSSLTVKTDKDDDGVFETTLVLNTDFRLSPFNSAAKSRPWTHIILSPGTVFPTHLRGVEVTGLWGWSTVPSLVVQATLIQAARFFQRRNAPFGVAGSPDLGSELRLLAQVDPDVKVALSSLVRHWVAV